ncbi:HalOD1 output domain-containing protein [Halomarina oriensis]|uniref:Halobacterial output domain-containing protein n=1 Tax=Halomarina oriensis TaxID=671145 RepID=A0A6B0GLZ6_9EURY|nr:HalOD1 output domain-containing protein [Halomarina oriensis]MWG35906.1 hypothetical protein [Halomarina oriensis]
MPSPSTRIVETVARREGVAPHELVPELYQATDPDALDQLFRGRDHGIVTIRFHGYRVTLTADEKVTVEEIENEDGSEPAVA